MTVIRIATWSEEDRAEMPLLPPTPVPEVEILMTDGIGCGELVLD
jgi:hypothetical protein